MPRAVTADRGYGQPAFERDLHDLGVRTVAIPRQGKISATRKKLGHSHGFRRLVKWRTGCEGRISYLKRGYGWDRTRLDGRHGAAIWCGHGVFACNLVKIGALAANQHRQRRRAGHLAGGTVPNLTASPFSGRSNLLRPVTFALLSSPS